MTAVHVAADRTEVNQFSNAEITQALVAYRRDLARRLGPELAKTIEVSKADLQRRLDAGLPIVRYRRVEQYSEPMIQRALKALQEFRVQQFGLKSAELMGQPTRADLQDRLAGGLEVFPSEEYERHVRQLAERPTRTELDRQQAQAQRDFLGQE